MEGLTTNWGRWGADDQLGTLNLLTPEVALAAAQLVRFGRVVPMARTVVPGEPNEDAKLDRLERRHYEKHTDAGAIVETYTFRFHGGDWTHLDGLSHVWDAPGLWNGRDPDQEVSSDGVRWADITHPARGMVGRGLLFDVLRWRSGNFVGIESPVTADELEAIAESRSIRPEPGDMIAIRAGRREWETKHGSYGVGEVRPGLDPSVLDFMADFDCSVLISDMLDAKPHGLDRQWSVHAAIYKLGAYLVDNAELAAVAETCEELEADQFMMVIAPLPIQGATASPVSPLAIF